MNGTVVVTVAALAAAAVVAVVVLRNRPAGVAVGVPAPQVQPPGPVAVGLPAPVAARPATTDVGRVVQDVAAGIGGAIQAGQALFKGVTDLFKGFKF